MKFKIGNIIKINKRKAIIIHVCPKYDNKNLYKILWIPSNNMEYTWWVDDGDMRIQK